MSIISGLREACDSLLSMFGFSDEKQKEETQKTFSTSQNTKITRDTAKPTQQQLLQIYKVMRLREANNEGHTHMDEGYITLEDAAITLNTELGFNKSRQTYVSLYKKVQAQISSGIDPFQLK